MFTTSLSRRRCRSSRVCLEALESRCLLSADPASLASFGQLPLAFEANAGQTDAQVRFLARGSGYALFLTPTEAVHAACELIRSVDLSPFDLALWDSRPRPGAAPTGSSVT